MKGSSPFLYFKEKEVTIMKTLFVAILNYKKPLAEVDKKREEHLNFIRSYISKGIFLAAGRQNPPAGGTVIAHKITKEILENILKEDPYYINGLADHTIIEFNAGLFSDGLDAYLDNMNPNI